MKNLLLTSTILFFALFSYAQEQKKHEKRSYVNEKGMYHVQAEMPIYLFVSTTPSNTDAHKLTSETTAEFANPMYLDGHGKHYIRHLDYEKDVPEQEVVFEIYADGIAPKTNLNFLNANKYVNKSGTYYGPGLSVEMNTKDEMSGIQHKYISVNSEVFKAYANAEKFTVEGKHNLKSYSVDNVGNVENNKVYNFTLDITPPSTKINYIGVQSTSSEVTSTPVALESPSGPNPGNNDNTTTTELVVGPKGKFTLDGTDNLSGVKSTYYFFDELEKRNNYTGKTLYIGWMNEGSHSIQYNSIDNVLNSETKKSYKFFLDKTAPIVDIMVNGDKHVVGNKTFVSERSRIELSATDNKAGVNGIYYSFGGSSYTKYEKSIEADRNFYLFTYGIDNVENKGLAKSNQTLYHLDNAAPIISSKYIGPQFFTRDTMFIRETTKVKLSGWDKESGLQNMTYALDNSSNKDYSKPFTVDKKGNHTVKYYGKDNVNNQVSKDLSFVVDNEAPEIFSHFGSESIGTKKVRDQELTIYSKHSKLYLAATDKAVGTSKIYYSINGGADILYVKPIKYFKSGKNYKINIKAVDYLGNESVSAIEFSVED